MTETTPKSMWFYLVVIIFFNFYGLIFIDCFMLATRYIFHSPFTVEQKDASDTEKILINAYDRQLDGGKAGLPLGWGKHYVWRIISISLSIAAAGFFTGAFCKTNGGRVALISCVPCLIILAAQVYLYGFQVVGFSGDPSYLELGGYLYEIAAPKAHLVISIAAIPLSIFLAYVFGNTGSLFQENFTYGTLLGVKKYHLLWLWLPMYFYISGLVISVTRAITGIFTPLAMYSFQAAIYIVAIGLVYSVLRGKRLSRSNGFVRALANLGILIAGILLTALFDVAFIYLAIKLNQLVT